MLIAPRARAVGHRERARIATSTRSPISAVVAEAAEGRTSVAQSVRLSAKKTADLYAIAPD